MDNPLLRGNTSWNPFDGLQAHLATRGLVESPDMKSLTEAENPSWVLQYLRERVHTKTLDDNEPGAHMNPLGISFFSWK